MTTLLTRPQQVKIVLRNGRRYGGRAEQTTPAFIHLQDNIDGKLHIVSVDEITEIIVLDGEQKSIFSYGGGV